MATLRLPTYSSIGTIFLISPLTRLQGISLLCTGTWCYQGGCPRISAELRFVLKCSAYIKNWGSWATLDILLCNLFLYH
ncbi:hypothetical protein BDZ97DRAFT_115421 [Flammula alnicola]|nr:hypothetical protein BDZ97DRAFT_115421 [Flammula alnicola]